MLEIPNLIRRDELLNHAVNYQCLSLPAICCARRIFCRLFHQHIKQITMRREATDAQKAMPIFAPAERWGPQVGNPGIPQRPALSVKLQKPL